MATTNVHSTVVRMLGSGRILRDSMRRGELAPVFARHADLVRHMAWIVGGTRVETRGKDCLLSTIYVRDKALIEVVSS